MCVVLKLEDLRAQLWSCQLHSRHLGGGLDLGASMHLNRGFIIARVMCSHI